MKESQGIDVRSYDGKQEFLIGVEKFFPGVGNPYKFAPDYLNDESKYLEQFRKNLAKGNPRRNAPIFFPNSREICFAADINSEEFRGILKAIGFAEKDWERTDFLVFPADSPDFRKDYFIHYARCVTHDSICWEYEALTPKELRLGVLPRQHMLSLGGYLWSFIKWQRKEFVNSSYPLTDFTGYKASWRGNLGFWLKVHGKHGTVDICSLPYLQ